MNGLHAALQQVPQADPKWGCLKQSWSKNRSQARTVLASCQAICSAVLRQQAHPRAPKSRGGIRDVSRESVMTYGKMSRLASCGLQNAANRWKLLSTCIVSDGVSKSSPPLGKNNSPSGFVASCDTKKSTAHALRIRRIQKSSSCCGPSTAVATHLTCLSDPRVFEPFPGFAKKMLKMF